MDLVYFGWFWFGWFCRLWLGFFWVGWLQIGQVWFHLVQLGYFFGIGLFEFYQNGVECVDGPINKQQSGNRAHLN